MELIDTLIEARWIIPIVPKGVILENSALAVNAGRIVDILPIETAEKTYQAQKVFRFPTSALLPGFVNLHSHAAMNLVRGLGADLPLMDWLTKEIWPAEGKLMSPEFVAEGSWLAGLEMAAGGVTTTLLLPDIRCRGAPSCRSALRGFRHRYRFPFSVGEKRH